MVRVREGEREGMSMVWCLGVDERKRRKGVRYLCSESCCIQRE